MNIELNAETIKKRWANEKPLLLNGKEWRVGKMSYGTFFLEPINYEGGEKDSFHPETIWLEKTTTKNQYGINQDVFSAEV